jgi:hypothetical protein
MVVVTVLLVVLGLDAEAIFLSVSGVVLAFAFMIGTASSKYFEGLLFILIRRPYAIGDGIHISDPNAETAGTGTYTTTAIDDVVAWWSLDADWNFSSDDRKRMVAGRGCFSVHNQRSVHVYK